MCYNTPPASRGRLLKSEVYAVAHATPRLQDSFATFSGAVDSGTCGVFPHLEVCDLCGQHDGRAVDFRSAKMAPIIPLGFSSHSPCVARKTVDAPDGHPQALLATPALAACPS